MLWQLALPFSGEFFCHWDSQRKGKYRASLQKVSVSPRGNSCCCFNMISGLIQMWHHTELRLGHRFYCQYTFNCGDFVTNLCVACVTEQNRQLETSLQFHPFVVIVSHKLVNFRIKTCIHFKMNRGEQVHHCQNLLHIQTKKKVLKFDW